jgi:hypothetical protein
MDRIAALSRASGSGGRDVAPILDLELEHSQTEALPA